MEQWVSKWRIFILKINIPQNSTFQYSTIPIGAKPASSIAKVPAQITLFEVSIYEQVADK
jgi:hypothetical protein